MNYTTYVDNNPIIVNDDRFEQEFAEDWRFLEKVIYETAKSKGFWETDRNDGEAIALMHSELSEALEALRHNNPPSTKCPGFSEAEEELADVVIRLLDFSGGRKLNVIGAIFSKMKYNNTRPYKHNKKF